MQSKREQKKQAKIIKQQARQQLQIQAQPIQPIENKIFNKDCWCVRDNNFEMLKTLSKSREISQIQEKIYQSNFCGTFTHHTVYVCSHPLKKKLNKLKNLIHQGQQDQDEESIIQIQHQQGKAIRDQGRDYSTLSPGLNISLSIIDDFINLINNYLKATDQSHTIVLPVTMTEGMTTTKQRYPLLKDLTQAFNTHGKWPSHIILPLQFEDHFFLARIEKSSSQIAIDDSLYSQYKNKSHITHLKKSINKMLTVLNDQILSTEGTVWKDIKSVNKNDGPQQRNLHDSGIYMINNIIKTIQGKNWFNDEDHSNFLYRRSIEISLQVGFLQYRLIQ